MKYFKDGSTLLRYERLSAADLMARYPQWCVGDNTEALYQAEGGLVDVALGNSL